MVPPTQIRGRRSTKGGIDVLDAHHDVIGFQLLPLPSRLCPLPEFESNDLGIHHRLRLLRIPCMQDVRPGTSALTNKANPLGPMSAFNHRFPPRNVNGMGKPREITNSPNTWSSFDTLLLSLLLRFHPPRSFPTDHGLQYPPFRSVLPPGLSCVLTHIPFLRMSPVSFVALLRVTCFYL